MPSGGNLAMLQALLWVPMWQILKMTLLCKTSPRIRMLYPKFVSFYSKNNFLSNEIKQQWQFVNGIVEITAHRCCIFSGPPCIDWFSCDVWFLQNHWTLWKGRGRGMYSSTHGCLLKGQVVCQKTGEGSYRLAQLLHTSIISGILYEKEVGGGGGEAMYRSTFGCLWKGQTVCQKTKRWEERYKLDHIYDMRILDTFWYFMGAFCMEWSEVWSGNTIAICIIYNICGRGWESHGEGWGRRRERGNWECIGPYIFSTVNVQKFYLYMCWGGGWMNRWLKQKKILTDPCQCIQCILMPIFRGRADWGTRMERGAKNIMVHAYPLLEISFAGWGGGGC